MRPRLTRPKDEYECRVAGGCPMEDWIIDNLGINLDDLQEQVCTHCPAMKYINRLAEYEDKEIYFYDDCK